MIDVNQKVYDRSLRLTVEQCRGARGMLGWSQGDLAKAANVGRQTIADFERRVRIPIANNLASISEALERAGIDILPDNALRLRSDEHVKM